MNIKKTAEWLRNIEELNYEERELKTNLQTLPEVSTHLQQLLEEEKEVMASLEKLIQTQTEKISKLTADLETLRDDLKQAESRSGEITNQKEYQATQKEIESSKKRQDMITESVAKEQKTLDDYQARYTQLKANIEEQEKALSDRTPKIASIQKDLEKKAVDVRKRIDNMTQELPETVTTVIHKLAQNNIHPFITEASPENVCSVCHMSFPAQLVLKAVKEDTFSQCPHCYRLLVPGDWVFAS